MSSTIELFILEPSLRGFLSLKQAKLVELVDHHKPTLSSSMKKDKIYQMIEEELIPNDEDEEILDSSAMLELEFQEKERA